MEERTIFLVLVLLWPEICFVCTGQFSFPSKVARQSQTYQSATPNRAIDGDPNTCSFAADYGGSSAIGWWQVDLGDIFTVYSVTVTSGTNDGNDPQYLQNFVIYVGDTNNTDGGNSNLCFYFNNGSFIPAGASLTFDCAPNPLNGRYVTIRRGGGFRQDAIGLCEVNIKYNEIYYSTSTSSTFSTGSMSTYKLSTESSRTLNLNTYTSNIITSTDSYLDHEFQDRLTGLKAAVIVLALLLTLTLIVVILFGAYIFKLKRLLTNPHSSALSEISVADTHKKPDRSELSKVADTYDKLSRDQLPEVADTYDKLSRDQLPEVADTYDKLSRNQLPEVADTYDKLSRDQLPEVADTYEKLSRNGLSEVGGT